MQFSSLWVEVQNNLSAQILLNVSVSESTPLAIEANKLIVIFYR